MRLKYLVPVLAVIVMLAQTACKKNSLPDMHLAIPSPANIAIDSLKPEKALVKWQYNDERARQFTIEVSSSSVFATIARSYIVKDSAREIHVDSLGSLTTYYVRVRALSDDVLYHSGYGTGSFVSEEIENIFLPIVTADLGFTTALIKWGTPKKGSVNKLLVKEVNGTASQTITLSTADVTAKQITLNNLKQATDYRVEIYEDDARKGILLFTTRDPNSVITINGSSVIYETLAEAIGAAKSGDIINVGGARYNFTAAGIMTIENKALTIQAVAGGAVPEIASGGFILKGNVPSLKIKGIKFTISASSYFVAATEATGTCDVQLEGLDISGPTAGLIYLSSSATPSLSFSADQCLIHDFGATGGDFIDFRAGTVRGMTIKNTTIWNVARDFLRTDATATMSGPLNFTNCTINNFCIVTSGSTNRFGYLRAAATVVTVNKCIVSNKIGTTNSTISGTGTSVTFTDSNVFGSNAAAITSNPTVKNNLTALDAQYENAAQGNFKVGNATIKAAGIGDPRWLN